MEEKIKLKLQNKKNIKLKDLVDNYIFNTIDQKKTKIVNGYPSQFITFNRLDIGFKLLYLYLRKKNYKLAIKIYVKHINSLTFGTFKEKGNSKKRKSIDFLNNFESLIKSFELKGFDSDRSLIPIEHENSIINGAHRLAIAIFLDKKISFISLNSARLLYDYKFFEKRNMPKKYIKEAVKIITRYDTNSYLAILWPSSYKHHNEFENNFDKILYKNTVTLSEIGKHNFIIELYKNEKWLGNFKNDYMGAINKKNFCFSNNNDLKIIIFQSNNKETVFNLKQKLRHKSNLDKHSIHISDDNNFENILNILFCNESLNLINTIKYSKLNDQFDATNRFKNELLDNGLDQRDFAISGSFLLSLYKLRQNNDLDVIYNNLSENSKLLLEKLKISDHEKYLKYFLKTKKELIYDKSNYFYFNNLKIINFENIITFKHNRNEKKDKYDISLIKRLNSKRVLLDLNILFQKINYYFYFYRYRIILLLIKFKLYNLLKKIFKN